MFQIKAPPTDYLAFIELYSEGESVYEVEASLGWEWKKQQASQWTVYLISSYGGL